jgi:hypothetical protein
LPNGGYPITVSVRFEGATGTATSHANILVELLPDGTRGTPLERFVAQVYRDLLGRGVDASGLATWTGKLQTLMTSGMSLSAAEQAVVYAIETDSAHEYFTDVVRGFYEQYLGRQEGASDAAGLALDVSLLAYGAANPGQPIDAEAQLRYNFLTSPEYAAKHLHNADFVESLYQNDFGRTALGDAGAASYVARLNAGTLSHTQVIDAVLFGGELATHEVEGWYQDFLLRPAGTLDLAHVQYLAQQIQAGVPEASLIAGFLADWQQEFYGIVTP